MKKITVAFASLCLILTACGSNNDKKDQNTQPTNAPASAENSESKPDLSQNPDYQKGLALVAKNDCLTCHKITGQATGPAYDDVANKYASNETNIDMLADKIIKGGSGHWGAVPMTPHPSLSLDDAKQMVKYVLLLRTTK